MVIMVYREPPNPPPPLFTLSVDRVAIPIIKLWCPFLAQGEGQGRLELGDKGTVQDREF